MQWELDVGIDERQEQRQHYTCAQNDTPDDAIDVTHKGYEFTDFGLVAIE